VKPSLFREGFFVFFYSMKVFLADVDRRRLLPLTFSRPTCAILAGIDTIEEKWEYFLKQKCSSLSVSFLNDHLEIEDENLLVNGGCIPTSALAKAIKSLDSDQVLTYRGRFIATKANKQDIDNTQRRIEYSEAISFTHFEKEEIHFNEPLMLIEKPSDIFSLNGALIKTDFDRITGGVLTTGFDSSITTKGNQIHVAASAKLFSCTLNASEGPIFIGENAEVMEGSLIRGPFSLGQSSTVKMGAKIYGDTTVGAHCKVGGEIANSVIHHYSNKGHDGYLGNSVLGSWCNLGADTNTSNLMNTYGEVKAWDYSREAIVPSGKQFLGLIMGDHSKAGINTMFNTGTVVGMCANVFGGGFPEKFVPSFSWGTPEGGFSEFRMDKAEETANAMMSRRNVRFGQRDKAIFKNALEHDRKYRKS
jgi:UDP-N-acetylglucosamine diphosphorylase/glucosamine-1-phosphate N-acetyltransferase